MTKQFMAIRSTRPGSVTEIISIGDTPISQVAERWQKSYWRTRMSGELEPCEYCRLDAGNIVDALVESTQRLPEAS